MFERKIKFLTRVKSGFSYYLYKFLANFPCSFPHRKSRGYEAWIMLPPIPSASFTFSPFNFLLTSEEEATTPFIAIGVLSSLVNLISYFVIASTSIPHSVLCLLPCLFHGLLPYSSCSCPINLILYPLSYLSLQWLPLPFTSFHRETWNILLLKYLTSIHSLIHGGLTFSNNFTLSAFSIVNRHPNHWMP